MKTRTIARVNNVDIIATSDEQLVAIKPICEALGIDYKVQWQKIKDDEDLSSVMVLSTTTGADGKQYEMCCLPVEFIFGWIFTVNPKNVKPFVNIGCSVTVSCTDTSRDTCSGWLSRTKSR